ncbi:type II toxin-antitoxin system MqsR family toxin [Vibrio splendidus]|jgi:hypothetical protein
MTLYSNQSPAYELAKIKESLNRELKMTITSRQSATSAGWSDNDVLDMVNALHSSDFHKSMPPVREGFTAMQDVYKPTYKGCKCYIKFQEIQGEMFLVLSCKPA